MWADINVVFGGSWPPSKMEKMSLAELCTWHEEARLRYEK
ncbi:MAG: GpE family phage tail protein [Gammaproteobacteria bacterium]|nr:MAG: GpE family phage tail protein [Gammaproteobacteria bacterium]